MRLALGHGPEVVDVARRLGVNSALAVPEVGLALGAAEIRLVELTAAYAGIANGGRRVAPRGVAEVRDNLDRVRWCGAKDRPPARAAVSAGHARAAREMLAEVVRSGTGQRADPGFFAAGKTGTTDESRDAWFVGFTDRFVAGVWIGNERRAPMRGVTRAGLPAEIWGALMRRLHDLGRMPLPGCAAAVLDPMPAAGPAAGPAGR